MVAGRPTNCIRRVQPRPNERHLRRDNRRHRPPEAHGGRCRRQRAAIVGPPYRAHRICHGLSTSQVADVRYSLVRPDGTATSALARSTAVGPVHRSRGDRYIAFDFEARIHALGTGTNRLIVPAQSGPWAPRTLRLALGVEVGSNTHLVTAAADGKERRRLTSGREGVRPLAWSPDGKAILFDASRGAAPVYGLYVVHVRDARVVRLSAAAHQGDFSPSGRRVVYSRETGGILTVALDGSGRRRLTGDGVMPRWSPNGRWIAFQAGARIDLIRPDGSNRHPLVGS